MTAVHERFSRATILKISAIMITGSFLAILNQTLLTTAIPHVMADLNLSESTAQWLTTIFMLVNGIMIPITAFLIETFTTRRLFLSAMTLFFLGTIVCAWAPNFAVLILGRIIQAAGAGVLMPFMMTIFLLIYPAHKRGTAMGFVGLVISFAPAIGPSLSGWILNYFEWRMLFLVMLPLILIDIILAYVVMRNVTELSFPKVDISSIVLSSIGFGSLLFGFSSAGNYGWTSPIVYGSLIIGSIGLYFFIRRQLHLENPILEIRIMKYKIFTLTTVIGMITFLAMISSETMLPIYMQNMVGYTALESGLVIMPGALAMGLLSPVIGRVFDRIGGRYLVITGLTIVLVTTLFFTNLSEETTLLSLAIVFGIRMIGLAFIMMPASTMGLNELPVQLLSHGTAVSSTLRQVAASIGTAILVTVMTSGQDPNHIQNGESALIPGVNNAFMVLTIVTLLGLLIAFFVRDPLKASNKVSEKE